MNNNDNPIQFEYDDYDEYQEYLRFKEMKRNAQMVSNQQGGVQKPATKYCKYCGAVIDYNAQVCPVCHQGLIAVHQQINETGIIQQNYDSYDAPYIALAFVPLLGIVMSMMGVGTIPQIVMLLLLNSVLLCFDISQLKERFGITDGWIYSGFFIIPVYMFLRASRTTKKYWPAIVWCVVWVVSLIPSWSRL